MGRHPKDCSCKDCNLKNNIEKSEQPTNDNKAFDQLAKELESKYNAKRASEIKIEPKIRIGLYPLDYVLDGGIAQCEGGHKIELFGRESSGKTTLALKIIAKYQELNKRCVFINAENSYDPEWAEINGVKNDNLLVVKPETMEAGGDLLISLIAKVDLIVVDSIVAMIPIEELEGGLEDKHMASQAKILAPMCRKINEAYKDYKTTIIFINQIREKLGVMYGNPETTSGGRAIRHLYDSRIEVRAGQPLEMDIAEGEKKSKEKVGFEMNLKCVKNKKGRPHHQAIADFYDTGTFDNRKSLLFAGIKYGIIKFSGKTYEYGEIKAVGKDAFMELLTDKILDKIEKDIWKTS